MADETTRDFRQRSLGCVGASMVVHVGLLALLVLAPESEALQPMGTPDGLAPGAVTVELETPATGIAEPTAATQAAESSKSAEVLLASADDANAVPLPAAEVEVVKPKAIAAPVFDEPKIEPKTEPKKAKVAKKPAIPKEKIASNEGDVEIQNAIAAARLEESKIQEVAQNEETISPTTSEPEAPTTNSEPAVEEVQEVETAKETVNETTVAAAAVAQPQAQQPEPAKTQEQPQAAAPAPVQAMAAATTQPSTGGTTAQPGIAAAQPGPHAAGRSMRAGGLGYSVPMGMQIRDASDLVARPGNPSPVYPQQDRLLGRQGLAIVLGRVSNDGSVISVQLERSSGSASMDQEALKTFGKWKFMPGQQGMVRKPFQFVLSGAAKEMPARLGR